MILDMHVLENYIQRYEIPNEHEWFYLYTNGYEACATNRQDVANALCEILSTSIKQFPYFNRAMIQCVFADELALLDQVIVLPIVSSSSSFDSKLVIHEGKNYFLIDILNIADYSIQVNEMQYILQNQITLTLLKYLIHSRYPKQDSYQGMLEDTFFCDGFAQYLAWNEDCSQYPFHDAIYQKRKTGANALLHKFYFSEDKELQDKVVHLLEKVDFWNQFPMVYGLFYFHDLYLLDKENGLYNAYIKGPHRLQQVLLGKL